ncbi:uncharacterized protein LOC111696134 [Eurytemora carolleeae]|uniref:uncharacterized protein LOC111696134 n=1 Tax=Eurytemora carolleeae TaxID=1294199 RepID=UPI000C78D7B3|nr:uncharacterized protein LOC111696134 [Eurytemora carolleeae]|eukprot:XP_023321456.1 uncharacterized protein LOC111696134 [Eurytemora affinis]
MQVPCILLFLLHLTQARLQAPSSYAGIQEQPSHQAPSAEPTDNQLTGQTTEIQLEELQEEYEILWRKYRFTLLQLLDHLPVSSQEKYNQEIRTVKRNSNRNNFWTSMSRMGKREPGPGMWSITNNLDVLDDAINKKINKSNLKNIG